MADLTSDFTWKYCAILEQTGLGLGLLFVKNFKIEGWEGGLTHTLKLTTINVDDIRTILKKKSAPSDKFEIFRQGRQKVVFE